ncbi:MAG TPA: ABC transporter C-terminal domain-containing protein [Streptosporangiaceae bacterium]|nr:ABC transporter C-terminal domain-containing protein [Streptosporangiaceae bacterium]
MNANTGLLTSRCDPFGAESQVKLLGGMYGEEHRGKYMWHCAEPAIGRYRMTCTGGDYGHRLAADAGLVAATHCDGGHVGQVMPLCKVHVREFTTGPPKPGFTRDLKTPVGQVGGTVANNMCTACMWPPEARGLQETADAMQQQLAMLHYQMAATGLMTGLPRMARLTARQDQVRARLDELYASGRIHKCPLKLIEVS